MSGGDVGFGVVHRGEGRDLTVSQKSRDEDVVKCGTGTKSHYTSPG